MTETPWRPLSTRDDPRVEPALFDGVPDHLDLPLRRWLEQMLVEAGNADRVGVRLRVSFGDFATARTTAPRSMLDVLVRDADALTVLNAVDAVLHLYPIERLETNIGRSPEQHERFMAFGGRVRSLRELLTDAGSAYRVAENQRGLERRVDPTVSAAAVAAREAADEAKRPEAARDLADAWAAVYGLHPQPSEAYRLAIRAVEDVAVSLVLPANPRATLGKVLAHLRDAPSKWGLGISPDIDPLVAMITLLWTRQTDRHAGQADLQRVDQSAAEMAVHLAVTLVQWFAAGHVHRVPDLPRTHRRPAA